MSAGRWLSVRPAIVLASACALVAGLTSSAGNALATTAPPSAVSDRLRRVRRSDHRRARTHHDVRLPVLLRQAVATPYRLTQGCQRPVVQTGRQRERHAGPRVQAGHRIDRQPGQQSIDLTEQPRPEGLHSDRVRYRYRRPGAEPPAEGTQPRGRRGEQLTASRTLPGRLAQLGQQRLGCREGRTRA